jgi:hypothetical protein
VSSAVVATSLFATGIQFGTALMVIDADAADTQVLSTVLRTVIV